MQVVNQTTRYYATVLLDKQILIQFKRVIVTPAVYQLLAQLKPSFKYWHWADVTDHTHLYRLAVS